MELRIWLVSFCIKTQKIVIMDKNFKKEKKICLKLFNGVIKRK
jgi:hypothetical protein